MKTITYLFGLLLMCNFYNIAFGQNVGCFPPEPYIDPKTHEIIRDEAKCRSENKRNLMACWVAADHACYFAGSPADCTCFNQKGVNICNGLLATGTTFGYCKWEQGNQITGCDLWRLEQGHCKYPGHKISNNPPDAKDYCRLLGGEVHDKGCVNYFNDHGEKQTCSLHHLWHNKCNN